MESRLIIFQFFFQKLKCYFCHSLFSGNMSISSFIILGVGLSVDSLAASITTGACSIKLRVSQIFKVALYMAVFQASMPLLGWFIGSSFKGLVAAYDHWIALLLLGSIGGKLIYDGLRKAEEESSCLCPSSHFVLAGMALATSIDALVVGIGFGVLSIHIWMAVFIIGITTFFFSVAGVLLGMTIGERLNKGLEVLGGLVLIGMGLRIFLSHTIEFIK
ncbi:putative Mn2+ efflux pump MntP [Marinilabilia salmonicolor]|jgi:putative Mn2+ efflux pump MntP|uniref:Putative manganese efflux pump MntP n=2 Tax=Marinilabilia salmonicolor TaxID=989 RepID=A0A2T0XQ34_9BACT|nr:putative Mn2+ efflux pump MntP [Marinilabilia salmonicolor]RCW31101.1 putative Mn2+ efflux pump MntP [Marinilabilia salmonicolor]